MTYSVSTAGDGTHGAIMEQFTHGWLLTSCTQATAR
jgi:hypothetical protein